MPRQNKVQPQPGSLNRPAPDDRSREDEASTQQPPPSVHPVEPGEGRLHGTRLSQQQQVLGLNVDNSAQGEAHAGEPGHQAQPHPAQAPAQHATGSSTGEDSNRKAS